MCKCAACSLKPVLDIYLTIEACSNILCNLHISKLWLFFRITVTFYVSVMFAYSIWFWIYDNKIKYFMAFYTNWVLIIQFIYFLFSSYITYKIYQEIQPKFEKSHSNRLRHNVSQQWDVGVVLSNFSGLQQQHQNANKKQHVPSGSSPRSGINGSLPQSQLEAHASYEIVGKPPNLEKLGYKKLFLFTKSLLELGLPYSFGVCLTYWLTIYNGHFTDSVQAIYYINTHGIIFILQLIDCYASTYQLRFIYGSIWIIIWSLISFGWMWLFEELNFINPFTKTNQLYAIFDFHNKPAQSIMIFIVFIIGNLIIFWFIVFTKNVALIKWKKSRQATNRQLSADDAPYYSSDDDAV